MVSLPSRVKQEALGLLLKLQPQAKREAKESWSTFHLKQSEKVEGKGIIVNLRLWSKRDAQALLLTLGIRIFSRIFQTFEIKNSELLKNSWAEMSSVSADHFVRSCELTKIPLASCFPLGRRLMKTP